MDFTKDELFTLSNGIIALIQDACKAKGLINSDAARAAIDDEIKNLQELNTKVCGLAKD